MDDLISRQALYEKTAEWEAQALHMVEVYLHDEDMTEWRKWSAILKERSAFKHDVADAPSAERRGKWVDGKRMSFDGTFYWFRQCSECLYEREDDNPEKDTNYCPNCGAKMDEAEPEDTYCIEENCPIYQRDLSCERCNR